MKQDIKENLIKARFIVIGLLLIGIPHSLEQVKFILNLFEKHNFWSGFATGVFIGIKIIGLCLFAYGIAFYVKKQENFLSKKKSQENAMKEKIVEILKGLNISELNTAKEWCELSGAYINMESELPDGTVGKVLDDKKTYLCCQVPIDSETCYGVAADEERIVIYRYKNDDSESKIIRIVAI